MFFIIWSGWGILAPIILVLCSFLTPSAVGAIASNPQYTLLHQWPLALGLALGGVVCWYVGLLVNALIVTQVEY